MKTQFYLLLFSDPNQPQMLKTLQQRVTECGEEAQKAPCKLVLPDPHPVVRKNFGATVHYCEIKREKKKERGCNKALFNTL